MSGERLKIAMVFPPMLHGGRDLDLANWRTAARGTTGSEVQCLATSLELAKRGHEVTLFMVNPSHTRFEGLKVLPYQTLFVEGFVGDQNGTHGMRRQSDNYDVVAATLDVNLHRRLSTRPLRVTFQQVNDFAYGEPGFAEFVDVFISPSKPHRDMMTGARAQTGGWWTSKEKWEVVGNGCYPDEYPAKRTVMGFEETVERVPGRVMYASSPDRGLHWLLMAWPRIKQEVPHAELRIFYYALSNFLQWADRDEAGLDPKWQDYARRAKYIKRALPALEGLGVKYCGSVSRAQMAVELSEAEVYAYPCDVVDWTEGFSCATLEGCASGAIPVISDVDALGEIYEGGCPMVSPPMKESFDAWVSSVIFVLQHPEAQASWRERGRALAARYSWPNIAAQVEDIFYRRLLEKKSAASQETR